MSDLASLASRLLAIDARARHRDRVSASRCAGWRSAIRGCAVRRVCCRQALRLGLLVIAGWLVTLIHSSTNSPGRRARKA